MLDVCLLGIGGMMPLPDRPLSAALARVDGETILWDCGEGTQVAWRRSGWPFRPTGTILLSHLHADHVAGLPGILFQIAHSGRTEPLTVYGPARTAEIVSHLVSIVGRVPYELRVCELTDGDTLEWQPNIAITAKRVQHRMECLAYRLDIARAGRFDADKASALGVPQTEWSRLQRGEAFGEVLPEQVLGPPRRGLRLALVTDTSAFDGLIEFVADSDLLVCEAMYADDEAEERAAQRGHMTARQAATIAARASVRQLRLTHLSPSVEDATEVERVAREEFPGAELATPGETMTLVFDPE